MHTILVPVDGSDHAHKALHIACDLAEKYDGKLVLLHILTIGKSASELLDLEIANQFGPKLQKALQHAAEDDNAAVPDDILNMIGAKILDDAVSKAQRRGVETDILPIDTGLPADSILIARKRINANTIVMGCRGIGKSDENSFGSVSSKVFAQAECTCLSVK